jgi:hypothetical protein
LDDFPNYFKIRSVPAHRHHKKPSQSWIIFQVQSPLALSVIRQDETILPPCGSSQRADSSPTLGAPNCPRCRFFRLFCGSNPSQPVFPMFHGLDPPVDVYQHYYRQHPLTPFQCVPTRVSTDVNDQSAILSIVARIDSSGDRTNTLLLNA